MKLHLSPQLSLPAEIITRLWAKVHKTESCWLWEGYRQNGQHGSLYHHGRNYYVHRISWVLHFGPIPSGMMVCHHCDVPNCVRPDHLFLGQARDNTHDMLGKDRGKKPPVHFGEAHPQARLSDLQVAEIRQKRTSGIPQRIVAKEYGVSQSTIWRMVHGIVRTGEKTNV